MATAKSSDDIRSDTRMLLVLGAVEAFSRSGYEGVSIRDIERRAGVNRGLAAYHFGTKEDLWKAAIEWLMEQFHAEMERHRDFLSLVSPAERGRVLLKIYVRFVARHPQFTRLLVLEGDTGSDRAQILVDQYLRPLIDYFHRMTGSEPRTAEQAAIDHFVFVGAASLIFAAPAQSQLLFGVDPTDEGFIERFADHIADMGY